MEEVLARLRESMDERTGISKPLLEELLTSRRLREEEAVRHAQMRVLLGELQGLAEDGDEALAALLAGSEAAQYVDAAGTVVGVTPEDVLGLAPEGAAAAAQRRAVPRVEERLAATAQRVAQFAGAASVERLAAEAASVAAGEEAVRREADELRALQAAGLEERAELLRLASEIARARTDRGVPLQAAHAEWMAAQAEGMACKMALVEKRLLRETYGSRDTMEALRKLQAAIAAAREAAAAHRSALALRKKQFADAGPEMERIAAEYAAVLKATEETQWALKEVTK